MRPHAMSKTDRPVLTDEYLYELERYFYELHLIEEYTGKSVDEVFNDYTIPQLIRISMYLDWTKFL